jgi:hypothetical protein
VLYVCGPGGVGKTTLLGEFAALAEQAGARVLHLDGRNVEPSPDGFVDALRAALGLGPGASPLDALATCPEFGPRQVLLVDTYEVLAPLDAWLRDVFLPELPDHVLVVLAGRQPPAPAWRADPAWQELMRVVPLRNLRPEESRAYLAQRELPAAQHDAVLAFTHGHPLALSLVADVFAQRRDLAPFAPAAVPDVVRALLERLVQQVPGPAHRAALEACALVRLTSEPLLAALLATADAHALFAWLRDLSFVESGRLGLFPHDLAREALAADLRWRNPDWHAELHRRARGYYAARLQQTRGAEQQRVLFDYVYLHRDNPAIRPFLEWREAGTALPDAMRAGDRAALVAMVARHEGDAAARLADYWFARQPEGVVVYRDAEQRPAGFVARVALEGLGEAELAADPVVRAAHDYVRRRAPLRPGERATCFRFWMARETYQAVSPMQTLLFGNVAQYYLTTPGLAFTCFAVADADFWAPVFAYLDLTLAPELAYESGGRRHGVYTHDWRAVPPVAWLDLLAERELALAVPAPPPPSEQLVVLSEPAFAAAVRDALQHLTAPDALRGNPLLRSRLVVERAGVNAATAGRVAALQALVTEAAEMLRASPRELKAYRALHHTYLQPGPTQERVAELLDLPFSTYRRHLTAGVARVVALLWQWELGGGAPPGGEAQASRGGGDRRGCSLGGEARVSSE